MNPLTLLELNSMVVSCIEQAFTGAIWLQSEVISVKENRGHCYMEFVQKDDGTDRIVAKAHGQIWAFRWNTIRAYFEQVTGQTLASGMNVLVKVEPTFHELYGYSLNVVDINPTFTLGDIARRRQEILTRLEKEGIADMNKSLTLPRLLQRIAVISAEGAAGWGDFYNQLTTNAYGLAFRVQLFEAVMQGERVEQSIISALNRIADNLDQWDAVVIIRGGGATSDLNGFDTLPLAENVAQFPLPVITGIGHERDDTVLDLISHTRVKTPTAAAEFILQHQLNELDQIVSLQERLSVSVAAAVNAEKLRIENLAAKIPNLFTAFKQRELHRMEMLTLRCGNAVKAALDKQHHLIEVYEAKLAASAPEHILRMGYSIVRHNDAAVSSASELHSGDELQITHSDGVTIAVVK